MMRALLNSKKMSAGGVGYGNFSCGSNPAFDRGTYNKKHCQRQKKRQIIMRRRLQPLQRVPLINTD